MAPAPGNELEVVSETLDHIQSRYRATKGHAEAALLVEWDSQLRRLIDDPWKRERKSFDGKIWKPEWSEIGVEVAHYGDNLLYTGKLLVEAHAADPLGAYRRFTLFSAILGRTGSSGLGEMPDLESAQEYLKEFPDGPFAGDVAIILGAFHDDLFKVFLALQAGEELGYKYDCFSKYILKRDLSLQAARARRLSLGYYAQALEVLADREPGWAEGRYVEEWKLEVKEGRSVGWHFCGD